jgi:CheY-like chemotaxis protein
MTILLVEDNADDCLFLARAFAALGAEAQLHFAGTVAEAWSYLSGDGSFADRTLFPIPELIITDLKLPGEFFCKSYSRNPL